MYQVKKTNFLQTMAFYGCLLFVLLVFWNGLSLTSSCSIPNSLLSPANRQNILVNFQKIRSEALNGNLLLNNGKYALQAESMPNLGWDCEMEAAMLEIIDGQCSSWAVYTSPNYTGFYATENSNTIDYYVNELSKTRASSLIVLSTKTIWKGPTFIPEARVLHDKVTKFGCAIQKCFYHPQEQYPRTILLCNFDHVWKINTTIYNVRTSTTAAPTTPELPTTPSCSNGNESIDKARALSLIEGKEMTVGSGMLLGFVEAGFMDPVVLDASEFAAHKTHLSELGLLN